MRKNCRRRVKTGTLAPAVVVCVIGLVLVALGYWFLDTKCDQLGSEIKRDENRLRKAGDECQRESARWKQNLTPEKLNEALMYHGLTMNRPKDDQIVRMDRRGVPIPGQRSLAKFARNKQSSGNVANK